MPATKGRMPANRSSVVYPLRAPISLVNETGTTPKTLKPALLSSLTLLSLFLPEEIVITPPIESCTWISRKPWIKNKPEDESLRKLKVSNLTEKKMKSALHTHGRLGEGGTTHRQGECVCHGRCGVWVALPYWIHLSVLCLRWISFAIACCWVGWDMSKTDTRR